MQVSPSEVLDVFNLDHTMKNRNPKLADVRKALSSKQVMAQQGKEMQGGWAPPKWDARNMFPFIVDTDKP